MMSELYAIEDYCKKCGRLLRNGKCEYGCEHKRKRYINSHKYNFNKARKTKIKTISKPEEEEEYYKPLSVEERRKRNKFGIQHLKKMVNDLPKVFRNTHLWKKYGEINHE